MISLFFTFVIPVFLVTYTAAAGNRYKILTDAANAHPESPVGKMTRVQIIRVAAIEGFPHLRAWIAAGAGWVWGQVVALFTLGLVKYRGDSGGQVAAPTRRPTAPPRPRLSPAGDLDGRAATPEAMRDVPSLRDDVRSAPPDPAVIGQQDVPALWVQLCTAIASFVPENETDELTMVRGWSAGLLNFSQAVLGHADNLSGVWNLSPPIIAGTIEVADNVMDAALLVAAHHQRMVEEYRTTRNAVADGTPLPNNAAQWFGDGTAA